jgi:two-component system, NarL family, invasion response regulator UvrY
VAAGLNGGPDGQERRASLDSLSKRELEVMCFLASGMTNREIAEQLGISVKTIDTHRGHLLKKLQLRNNSDITRFAIRHGLVQL